MHSLEKCLKRMRLSVLGATWLWQSQHPRTHLLLSCRQLLPVLLLHSLKFLPVLLLFRLTLLPVLQLLCCCGVLKLCDASLKVINLLALHLIALAQLLQISSTATPQQRHSNCWSSWWWMTDYIH